jgi:hypothetical protein
VFVGSLIVAVMLFAGPATAQEPPDQPTVAFPPTLTIPAFAPRVQLVTPAPPVEAKRPAALLPLYVSLAALQGLDIHSTRRGISAGETRESNPLMKPFVQNDAAFIAVKAAATAGTILVTEKLRKTRPKTAVILAAVFNAGMAAVVVHNYRVARGR